MERPLMDLATYEQIGNTLIISGHLDWPLDVEFDLHTKAFIEEVKKAQWEDVRIDVSGVDYMGSQYLGALAAIASVITSLGGKLTVKAAGQVAQTIHNVGLHRIMDLEVV